jgi:CRISPR-associated endonuclease Cas1
MQSHGIAAPTIPAKRIEQRRDWNLPPTPQRKDGEVVIADGYGLTVRVNRGHLVINDGIPGEGRRERRYGRATSNLARLVVLGGSGVLSLDAIRWLDDVGAALVCIDRDGKILCGSGPTRSEAKLRRAQALAQFNASGLAVAKTLLTRKLAGQQQLLGSLPADRYAERTLERTLIALEQVQTIGEAMPIEADAAAAYWGCWADVEVRFQPTDQRRVSPEWRSFGQRTSTLSGSPRMAVNPAGAILNYLYALLEAEARLACLTLGLDPALAFFHADVRGRDSLPLDLMEAIRPSVDRYLLAFLRDRVFRAADFHQSQRGNCRLLAPLTHELAQTLPAWRQLVAPVAEQVAALLHEREPAVAKLPTPLTQANRRADRARRHTATQQETPVPRPEPHCKRCGGRLPARDRTYCDDCLPHYQRDRYDAFIAAGRDTFARRREAGVDPSHGGVAAERRGATMARRKREEHEWNAAHGGTGTDPDVFAREILPTIQALPLSDLVRATGLTHGYLSKVRRGEKVPHPRHWPALELCTQSADGE